MSGFVRSLRAGLLALTICSFAAMGAAQAPPSPAPVETTPADAAPAEPPVVEDVAAAEAEATPAEAAAPPADVGSTEVPTPAAPPAAPEAEPSTPADLASSQEELPGVSEADLTAFIDATQLEEATSAGPSLRVYGFMDFSVAGLIDKTPARKALRGDGTAFYVGNLNVYLDADLTHGVRSLAEVRFTYLPNGAPEGAAATRFNASAFDYADATRSLYWGGIEIERAWVEYAAHNLFVIRAGQYLTPYGIWNVDHATVTIIPTLRPYVVGEALIPERQVGFQIYGSQAIGPATLGYHFTLSNGRGNVQYVDFDKNKAVGGRVFTDLDLGRAGTLSLGLSGYAGRRTDTALQLDGTSLSNQVLVQWDEVSYAGDLLWKWKGLHLQYEAIGSDIRFTDEGRYSPIIGARPNARLADYRRWGMYGLLGYRTPWVGLMPYVMVSVFRPGAPSPVDVSPSFFDSVEYSGGLNMRPIAALALKVQYTATVNDSQVDLEVLASTDVEHSVTGQIAWSF